MARPQKSEGFTGDSLWGGPRAAFVAILAAAAAVRIVGLRYGLPFPLADAGEEEVVPRAWSIAHGGGADPDPWFDAPSLLLYLNAPFQWAADQPSYLAARIVSVVLGLAGIAATWWLGARAYGVLAGGVAAAVVAVATVHVAYSRLALPDVALALVLTVALVLLVDDRIELAGLAVGVAAALKYPGVLALVPLVVVAWRRPRRLALGAALAIVGFAAASPYAVIHAGEALGDVRLGLRLARRARSVSRTTPGRASRSSRGCGMRSGRCS